MREAQSSASSPPKSSGPGIPWLSTDTPKSLAGDESVEIQARRTTRWQSVLRSRSMGSMESIAPIAILRARLADGIPGFLLVAIMALVVAGSARGETDVEKARRALVVLEKFQQDGDRVEGGRESRTETAEAWCLW